MVTRSEKLFDYLCRTCMHELVEGSSRDSTLNDQQSRSIFDTIEACAALRLAELLSQAIPQIEVELNDELPKKICSECLQQLVGVYRFQEMCRQTQQHMQELIADRKSNLKLPLIEATADTGKNEKLSETTTNYNDPLESGDGTVSCQVDEVYDNGECKVEYSDGDTNFSPLPLANNAFIVTEKRIESSASSAYMCDICKKHFSKSRYLKNHLIRHKEREEKKLQKQKTVKKVASQTTMAKKYQCKSCDKCYKRSNALRNHMRTHTGERPFLCPECGKSFTASNNLKNHLGRHSDIKAYECPLCPKKFRCSSNLSSHRKTHNAVKSHICDICGYAFMQAGMLKKHKLNHSGEKKYKCEFCEMRFVRADQQRRHMRTHTGEKPYKCKYCECAYAQGNDLIKHLRIHLGDNVYRCELCPLAFRLVSELNLHITEHKNEDAEMREQNMKALKEAEAKLQSKLSETTCNLCNKSRSQLNNETHRK